MSDAGSVLRDSLARYGFVLIPSVLSPPELDALRLASARTAALARSGHWPHFRTLPRQFPPWGSDPSVGICGVQHLLHPSLPDAPLFASSYFSDAVLGPAKDLLECTDDQLVLELYNLLVRPDADFALRWHRDDILAEATPDEERELLARAAGTASHAQWNFALCDDASLIVVPGSHARARTEEERAAGPFEDEMPGTKVVKLRPGDCVMYDNNILHRGVYRADIERMTLHGSVGVVGYGRERAWNVLQHGMGEWVEKCDFSVEDRVRERAEGIRARAVETGSQNEGDVGFFSKDE